MRGQYNCARRRVMYRKPETEAERLALAVPCPRCKAPRGSGCVNWWGGPVDRGTWHAARLPLPIAPHPWTPETDTERAAARAACPKCHAPRGSKCVTRSGRPVERGMWHAARGRS